MNKSSLYSDDLWKRFSEKTGTTIGNFKLKKYPQFDPYYNFVENSDRLKKLVKDPTLASVKNHSFLPFVKILAKVPRYRYQNDLGSYTLENKIRPIAFASHFDSYLYAFYSFAINEKYQYYIKSKGFDSSILAYRSDLEGKCNIQFANDAFNEIKKRTTDGRKCAAIALDITGYFDNIDHKILKEKWSKVIEQEILPIDQYKIFRSLTKYSYVKLNSILKHFNIDLELKRKEGVRWQALLDLIPNNIGGKDFNSKFNLIRERKLLVTNLPKEESDGSLSYRGIPQGSPMSALLSNIYLIDFDALLYKLSKDIDFRYFRYCDDLLIICDIDNAKDINEKVLNEIKKYSLVIQNKKTEYVQFKLNSKGKIRGFNQKKIDADGICTNVNNENKYYKNLQYLGFEFNGENIYIRPGSLSRYFRKMKGRIVKSIMMSYSNKGKSDKIFKKQLYDRYSHIGKRNFLSYARNAANKTYTNSKGDAYQGMDSKSIKRQLSAHFGIIKKEVIKTSTQRFSQEVDKTKKRKLKGKRRKPRLYKE
ncbi:MAG: reverse transcriptase domain-containing protein [bacterium]|nr:reverse transcriptase domain-containing protein [bacterium]